MLRSNLPPPLHPFFLFLSISFPSFFKIKSLNTPLALNNIQFISDESSAELVLYLCEQIKCIAPSTFKKKRLIEDNSQMLKCEM